MATRLADTKSKGGETLCLIGMMLEPGAVRFVPLRHALGRGLLDFARVRCVQADAADARRLLNQVFRDASGTARHYRACRQCKAQRVGLILEIQNYLPGHKNSPECDLRSTAAWKELCRRGLQRLTKLKLCSIVRERGVRSKCFLWFG